MSDPVPAILGLLCCAGARARLNIFEDISYFVYLPYNAGIPAWQGCSVKMAGLKKAFARKDCVFPLFIELVIDFIFTLSVYAFAASCLYIIHS
jgi:hypothetical protein